jgi:hypothetical protein
MSFQINPLPNSQFEGLFDLSDEELKNRSAKRVVADSTPGFPCRVSLADAEVGEELILLNHEYLSGNTPYAACHAIYVRKDSEEFWPDKGDVPDVLTCRLLSVRGFDEDKLMIDADVIDGENLKSKLEEMFENLSIRFIDIHNAKRGCFAAKATRA